MSRYSLEVEMQVEIYVEEFAFMSRLLGADGAVRRLCNAYEVPEYRMRRYLRSAGCLMAAEDQEAVA